MTWEIYNLGWEEFQFDWVSWIKYNVCGCTCMINAPFDRRALWKNIGYGTRDYTSSVVPNNKWHARGYKRMLSTPNHF
jgi:hypothetical protein